MSALYIPESVTELAIAQLVQTERHYSRSEITARIRAARAFCQRFGTVPEWDYDRAIGALYKASEQLDGDAGLAMLVLCNDIALLRRILADRQQEAA